MKKYRFVVVVLLSVLMGGCYDIDDFNNVHVEPISPSYVFPLINSTVTFKELVERSGANTMVDTLPGTTMFYMAFRDTQQLFLANELFLFTDIPFSQSIEIPSDLVPPAFPQNDQISFEPTFSEIINPIPDTELKEVQLIAGNLNVSIVNNFNHRVSGFLRIKSLKNSNGVEYMLPFDLATFSSSISDSRLLNSYILSLHNTDANTYNTFEYEAIVTITSSGNPSMSGSIDISFDIQDVEYDLLIGKFNASYTNDNLKYYISVFNATYLADQYFADPSMKLTVQNSFGVPISLAISQFDFRTTSGTVIPITNIVTPTPADLNLSGNNLVDYLSNPQEDFISTSFILNTQNSNIDNAFEYAPSELDISAGFSIGGSSDNHNQFIRNDSGVKLVSEITLPLYGRITTHVLSDTIANFTWPDLSGVFSQNPDLQDELKILFRFKFSNELPFDLAFQAEFLDAEGNVVDQFFGEDQSEWFVESAPVGSDGETVGSTPKISTIELTKERYDELSQSNSIVFFYQLHTGGDEGVYVKVLSTNKIGIQLSVFASLNIDLTN